MLQKSKIIASRNDWKRKAVQRANEIREYRKSQKHHKEKITKLQEQITVMKKKFTNNYKCVE